MALCPDPSVVQLNALQSLFIKNVELYYYFGGQSLIFFLNVALRAPEAPLSSLRHTLGGDLNLREWRLCGEFRLCWCFSSACCSCRCLRAQWVARSRASVRVRLCLPRRKLHAFQLLSPLCASRPTPPRAKSVPSGMSFFPIALHLLFSIRRSSLLVRVCTNNGCQINTFDSILAGPM